MPVVPPPAGPMMAGQGTGPKTCAVDNIQMLPASDANRTDPHFVPAPTGSAPADKVRLIKEAYDLAPPFFREQLCDLNGLYIVPKGESWGLRNPDTKLRYVALSADLWPGGGSPKPLPEYLDDVDARLIRWPGGVAHDHHPAEPAYGPAMTILGVLAHEYGHVLFYDTFVDPPGSAPKYDDPKGFCGGTFFRNSWRHPLPNSPIPWRVVDQVEGEHGAGDIRILDIMRAAPGLPKGDLVHKFYALAGTPGGQGRWASLWAGFSPDHDFVETFRLFVMMNSSRYPLRSLGATVPTSAGTKAHDIPATCRSRPILMSKLACFQQALCTPPNSCTVCP
jgi:hypothetical protein